MVYYEVEDFVSSYRTFVDSKNYKQLRGNDVPADKCHKIKKVEDLREDYETLTELGARVQLNEEEVANPCGLVAQFVFSDTFELYSADDQPIAIDDTDIAHRVDRTSRFQDNENPNIQWLDVTNEHFMVWNQMETQSGVYRLYGRISSKLSKGSYTIKTNNSWP